MDNLPGPVVCVTLVDVGKGDLFVQVPSLTEDVFEKVRAALLTTIANVREVAYNEHGLIVWLRPSDHRVAQDELRKFFKTLTKFDATVLMRSADQTPPSVEVHLHEKDAKVDLGLVNSADGIQNVQRNGSILSIKLFPWVRTPQSAKLLLTTALFRAEIHAIFVDIGQDISPVIEVPGS